MNSTDKPTKTKREPLSFIDGLFDVLIQSYESYAMK